MVVPYEWTQVQQQALKQDKDAIWLLPLELRSNRHCDQSAVTWHSHRNAPSTALTDTGQSSPGSPGRRKNKTAASFQRVVVWDLDAEKLVGDCLACQVTGPAMSPTTVKTSELPSHPWCSLHMDFCGPFPTGEALFVVIDPG